VRIALRIDSFYKEHVLGFIYFPIVGFIFAAFNVPLGFH